MYDINKNSGTNDKKEDGDEELESEIRKDTYNSWYCCGRNCPCNSCICCIFTD